MEFQCLEHGKVDEFELSGYGIAHEPQVKAHEKDFEGITFVVESPENGKVTPDNIKAPSAESYLEKFAGWRSDVAEVVQNFYETGRGVEDLECPYDHTSMSITHIVDQIFIPNIKGKVVGSFTVYDRELQISDIQETGDVHIENFFKKIVNQAEVRGISQIKIESYNVDQFEDPLDKLDFDIKIKDQENNAFRGNYSRLVAEKDIS
jgi:hypothetical protein